MFEQLSAEIKVNRLTKPPINHNDPLITKWRADSALILGKQVSGREFRRKMMVALCVVHRVIHNIRGYGRFLYRSGRRAKAGVVYRGFAALVITCTEVSGSSSGRFRSWLIIEFSGGIGRHR